MRRTTDDLCAGGVRTVAAGAPPIPSHLRVEWLRRFKIDEPSNSAGFMEVLVLE